MTTFSKTDRIAKEIAREILNDPEFRARMRAMFDGFVIGCAAQLGRNIARDLQPAPTPHAKAWTTRRADAARRRNSQRKRAARRARTGQTK